MPRPTFPPIAVSSWAWRRASQQIQIHIHHHHHGGRRLLATEATAVTAPTTVSTRDEAICVPVAKLGAMRVTVLENSAAVKYATEICDLPASKKDLVFMSDAACVNQFDGAYAWAVVYKDPESHEGPGQDVPKWKRVTGVLNGATTASAEFWALLRAQEVAEKLIVSLTSSERRKSRSKRKRKAKVVESVKFFGDCRAAIMRSAVLCAVAFTEGSEVIGVPASGKVAPLCQRGLTRLDLERFVETNNRLRQLVPVTEMHWTPREGNREADHAVRDARDEERARIGLDPRYLVSQRQPETTAVLDKGMRQVLRLAGGVIVGTAMLWAKFC